MEKEQDDDNVVKINLQELAKAKDAEDDKVHKVDLSDKDDDDDEGDDTIKDLSDSGDDDMHSDDSDNDTDDSDNDTDDSNDDSDDDSDDDPGDSDDGNPLKELTDDDDGDDEDDSDDDLDDSDDGSDDPKNDLPDNIQKLVDFMNDTGGTIDDYVLLNKDVDSMDDTQLLKEYHKTMEPGLDDDEIEFLMEDLYDSDEELDSERDIKKKSIAKKRDISKAKKHLEGLKTKYYDEIKAGSKLNPEQKKAVDFFNRYNSEQEGSKKTETHRREVFTKKSSKLFSDKFKGFEFQVGEKRFRFNVKNVDEVKTAQADINNFAKKYLGDDNTLKDAEGYHKALFTAMNADAIANHFYKQGAADMAKKSAKDAKNINMDARGVHGKNRNQSGIKARVVGSNDSPGKLRIKTK